MRWTLCFAACLACAASSSRAAAGVTLLSQTRTLSVATTFDANIQTAAATDFAPFVRALKVTGVIPGVNGPIPVVSGGRIDCQLDPNKVSAKGLLSGAGGIAASTLATEMGDSKVVIIVDFHVDTPTPFGLLAAPRPALHATDEFRIELRDQTRHDDVFSLTQEDAPQTVNTTGTLQPGDYSMTFKVEGTFDGDEITRNFAFSLTLPPPPPSDCNSNGTDDYAEIILGTAPDANHNGIIDTCECLADWNGGGLSPQDIFDFLNDWFAGSGDFDNSGEAAIGDVFAFLSAWFAGC